VLVSDHATDKFDIKIDFDDIVLKHDKTKKKTRSSSRNAEQTGEAGEIDLIQQKMKDANDFVPNGSLPYTTYKYTVIVKNITTGRTSTTIPTSTCRRLARFTIWDFSTEAHTVKLTPLLSVVRGPGPARLGPQALRGRPAVPRRRRA
jgi:hypothetical protein